MEDRICPFNSIREMQQYASSLAMTRVSPPSITWSEDYSTVSFKGNSVKISNMRQGLIAMEKLITDLLGEVSFQVSIPYHIPTDLVDDMTDHSIGYSWLNNGHFTSNPHVLLKTLLDDPRCKLGYIDDDGNYQWNQVSAQAIMLKLNKVNSLFSVLLHIIPSQPSRATEHVDNKIRNSWRLRNLFRKDGDLWIVVQYTKTSNITGHDSFIPMLIPTRLRILLERYLIVFRPLEIMLSNVLWGSDAMQIYHDYLYVDMGQRVKPDDFSDTLKEVTGHFMKSFLTVNPYRHIAVAIKREFIPSIYHTSSTHEDEIGDQSSGHSTAMARRIYASQNGDLPYLTTDSMRIHGIFSQLWHNFWGFGTGTFPPPIQRYFNTSSSNSTIQSLDIGSLQQLIYNTVQTALLDKFDLKQSVSNNEALLFKMSTQSISPNITPDLVDSSTTYHNNIPSLNNTIPMDIDNDITIADTGDIFLGDSLDQADRLTTNHIPYQPLDALRHCYKDPTMAFKSNEQESLINHVLQNKADIIAVLPTGGGKSSAFEIPASVEEGFQTVVVVPFVAILNDMEQRVSKLGIQAVCWNSKKEWPSPSVASLILVVLETAAGKTFKEYVYLFKSCH